MNPFHELPDIIRLSEVDVGSTTLRILQLPAHQGSWWIQAENTGTTPIQFRVFSGQMLDAPTRSWTVDPEVGASSVFIPAMQVLQIFASTTTATTCNLVCVPTPLHQYPSGGNLVGQTAAINADVTNQQLGFEDCNPTGDHILFAARSSIPATTAAVVECVVGARYDASFYLYRVGVIDLGATIPDDVLVVKVPPLWALKLYVTTVGVGGAETVSMNAWQWTGGGR